MPLRHNGLLGSLLRVPLFYKIMIANLTIVFLVLQLGTDLVGGMVVMGIAVLIANAVILRVALSPLHGLEAAAARVNAGDLSLRARSSVLADREMDELIATFNAMLDTVADARGKQRDLSIRALHAAEEERKRVATDLHDKIAQTLAGLLLQLSLLKTVQDEAARKDLIKQASETAAFVMDEVYRVVQALRPPALELLGLTGAIEAHARALQEESGINIEVHSNGVKAALDAEREIATYRIVQEALSNVVRHSKATRARVELHRSGNGLTVSIVDNGVGFSTESTNGPSLGLFGMQERASYMGGSVDIRSDAKGTTIEVKIPVIEVL